MINILFFYDKFYLNHSQPYVFTVNFFIFGIKFLFSTLFYDGLVTMFVYFIDFFKHKLSLFIPISHIYQESFTFNSMSFASHSNFIKNLLFRENSFFDNFQYLIFFETSNNVENQDLDKMTEIFLFFIANLLPFYCLHKYWNMLYERKKVILNYHFKLLVFFFNFNKKIIQ